MVYPMRRAVRPLDEYTVDELIRWHRDRPIVPIGSDPRYRRHERVAKIFAAIRDYYLKRQKVVTGALPEASTAGMRRVREKLRLNGSSFGQWVAAYRRSILGTVDVPVLGRPVDEKSRKSILNRALAWFAKERKKHLDNLSIMYAGGPDKCSYERIHEYLVENGAPPMRPRMLRRFLRAVEFRSYTQRAFDHRTGTG